MKVKEVIVVEGKDDTVKVKQAVDADTIETNGSAIDEKTIEQIQHAQNKRGVIIFTDPDYPGERIRHIIDQAVPGCKHAFLTTEQARAKHSHKKSLGIEHASLASIQQALAAVYEVAEVETSDICRQDLMNYGLIGSAQAKERRKRLGELLQIGQTNGKQLLKRLNMFQITKAEMEDALLRIQQEETNDR
ncbi:MAG TPA: ribonuclease M5 [Bacillota bacterium]